MKTFWVKETLQKLACACHLETCVRSLVYTSSHSIISVLSACVCVYVCVFFSCCSKGFHKLLSVCNFQNVMGLPMIFLFWCVRFCLEVKYVFSWVADSMTSVCVCELFSWKRVQVYNNIKTFDDATNFSLSIFFGISLDEICEFFTVFLFLCTELREKT